MINGNALPIRHDFRGLHIAFDFDGTITMDNRYPEIGEIRPGIQECIKRLNDLGAYIIIYTCRDECTEIQLEAYNKMLSFLRKNDIYNFSVNKNIRCGFVSRKPFAHIYVDDASLFWDPQLNGMQIFKQICKRLNVIL